MTNMDSKNIYTCDLKRYENEIGGGQETFTSTPLAEIF